MGEHRHNRMRWAARAAGMWLWASMAVGSTACQRDSTTASRDAGPPPVEPIIPTPSASTAGPLTPPAWTRELPAGKPTVHRGQRVWATVPERGSELASTGIYVVEGLHDGLLSLTDKMGQRVDGVPPAVVHRAGKTGKLSEGQVVLCYAFTLPAVLGRIIQLRAGHEIRVRYDWAGTTKEDTIYHAEQPRKGVQPLAFVGFPKAGAMSRGLVVALSHDRAWLGTSSGHVEVHPRREITALPVPNSDYSVGQVVRAYAWATGYQPGHIDSVLEPGLRYRVKLDSGLPEREYFFSNLIASR